MDALTPLLLAGAALGLATTIMFQALKPFAEAWIVKPADPLHDAVLRVLLYVVACGVALLGAISARQAITDAPAVVSLLKAAAGGWLVAWGTYHALTGDILGSFTPAPQTAPAAPTVLLPASAAQSATAAPIATPAQPGGQGGSISAGG